MTTSTDTCDLLLKARYIVTQDDQRHTYENAAIAIRGGQVAAVGTAAELAGWQASETRDLGNALVMPGLTNAHTHVAMTFLRGLADDMPLLEWLEKRIFPVEANLTAEIVRTASLMGFAEMLASGTTACLDMYYFGRQVLEAAHSAGIRCVTGDAILMFPNAASKTWQEGLANIEAQMDGLPGTGRLGVSVSPHAVYTTTPEILVACRNFAQKHGLPLHIHLAETVEETERCLSMHKQRPVELVHNLGLLDMPVTLAHMVDVTEKELDLVASHPQVVIAHNPSSNMKLASGAAPVPDMLSRGIRVGLGSDGAASNNRLNMFTEMGRCALMHKLVRRDCTATPATQVLDMATRNSAASLHNARLGGALAVGSPADLTALDLDRPNMQPVYAPVSHLVYAATGAEVVLTMVDGEVLYDHGTFTRFDYAALCAEMDELRKATLKLVG